MSDIELRPSTLKATLHQEDKSRIRKEIQESKKKSTKLSELISLEEENYQQEVEDFSKIAESVLSTKKSPSGIEREGNHLAGDEVAASSSATTAQQTSLIEESDSNSAESVSTFIDPLHAVRTPRKISELDSPSSLFLPRERYDSDDWSTVNRFFPAGCLVTPQLEYREQVPSSSSQVASPTLRLHAVEEETASATLGVEEEADHIPHRIGPKPADPIMDVFNQKIAGVNKIVRQLERRIAKFTIDDLTVADKDTYRAYIDENERLLGVYTELNDEIIDALEDAKPEGSENLEKLKDNEANLTLLYRQHAKGIKEKMIQLLTNHNSTRPLTAAETTSLDIQKQKEMREQQKEAKQLDSRQKRCEIKMKNTVKKSREIQRLVDEVKSVDEMSENEVRQFLLESRAWEKKTEDLTKTKESIEEDFIGETADVDLEDEFENEFQDAIDKVADLIKKLTVKDKEKGLYTLAPSKSKEKVVYPDPFTGIMGENVYKFCKEIKEAIEADQVRTADQVKTFRKYLKGDAKLNVGEHYPNLNDAMEALVTAYGNPRLIWNRLKEKLFEKINSPSTKDWGREDTSERLNAVNKVSDFLKQAHSLAKEYEELKTDVYHSSTIEALKSILPHTYWRKWKDRIQQGNKPNLVLMRLEEVLDEEKDGTLTAIQYTKDQKSSRSHDDDDDDRSSSKQPYSRSSRSNNSYSDSNRHFCKDSVVCKREWGIFGCIELYKIQKESERRDYISKTKCCPECGSFPLPVHLRHKGHRCFFSQEKYDVRCTGITNDESCKSAAVLCSKHKDNASPVLRAWLAKNNVKFTVSMIMLTHPKQSNSVPDQTPVEVNIEEFIKFADILDNTSSVAEKLQQYKKIKSETHLSSSEETDILETRCRDLLQKGVLCRMMDDEELVEFFTADLKRKKVESPVLPIPPGEPVFVFCPFQGKTRTVMTFIDSGANCWLSLDGIPQKELDSVMLAKGPIPLGVASGLTVNAKAEWASLIPLADNTSQVVRGLTMDMVTGDMPQLNLVPVFESIKAECKAIPAIQDIKVPNIVGGNVDMILGIKYQKIFPEIIHTFPNGLTIFKSKLKPIAPGMLACIGGPVDKLEELCEINGSKSAISYMSCLIQDMKNFRPRMEFFPSSNQNQLTKLIDSDIPGCERFICDDSEDITYDEEEAPFSTTLRELTSNSFRHKISEDGVNTNDKITEDDKKDDEVMLDSKCNICSHPATVHLIQSELEKFMKMQDTGLSTAFKCPRCRSCKECLRGPGQEMLSMQQEAEQELIKDSVRIDQDMNRALAFLAFTADPELHLKNNFHIAVKRLNNVCRKYSKNQNVKKMIMKGFQKLVDRGHITELKNLTPDQRQRIESSDVSYWIPWDVGFKETSTTTPARPTFDASSKTSTGFSLNDILAKGSADLVSMVSMVLDWLVGPIALCGDISQFYNTVLLELEHWKFQQVVWYDDLDPTNPLKRGVVRTCIYGVKCVGSQTEEIKRLLARMIEGDFPEVAEFLLKYCYVDDLGRSRKTNQEADDLISNTEKVLKILNMMIKGWAKSGVVPPPELSEDGVSVGFAGMTWLTVLDSFKLNIDRLHFGKKKRGRYPDDLKKFDGSFGMTLEEFVPKTLNRLMCTSVTCRLFDIPGKIAPLTLRLKHDLRKIIQADPDWHNPIAFNFRGRWIQNFKMIEELRDVLYVRCPIPSDALRPTVRIILQCDGADGGMLVTAHSGNERADTSWSCNHLFAKSLLAPANWSTPKLELHALSSLANIFVVLANALGDWAELFISCGDSTIALSWTIYEKVKLHVFHRMRVSNIRSKLDMEHLYHLDGKENVADIGTRPDLLTVEQLMPGSDWISGRAWMREPLQKAIESGIITNTKDIKLSNDAKKVFREAIIYDSMEDNENKVNTYQAGCAIAAFKKEIQANTASVHTINNDKVLEREIFANYIYPPMKRSFRPTVRIIAHVLRAVAIFKKKLILAKIRRGEADKSELKKLIPAPVKFTAFHMFTGIDIEKQMKQADPDAVKLSAFFRVNGVVMNNNPNSIITLSDEDLSASLEYIYKKETQVTIKFNEKKALDKLAVLQDGILYCKTRLVEGQTLRLVGGLENSKDLQSLTGINFQVPVLDKHSPMAVSIALHLHYQVVKHKGYETTYRMSLQFARILQGRILLKDVSEDCMYCKRLRLSYLQQMMGPLSDLQLTISPIFYYTYVDAWGPVKSYVPGYERETRSGHKTHELYMVTFGCAATAMINCQMMEGGKDTGNVLEVFNRFFHEICVPKICLPDQDGALMKALIEGEVDMVDLAGVLSRERGITFQTCVSQGHSAHGRIERRIKMIQECLNRSGLRGQRMHSLGWQTLAKTLEHEVNSIPLGYLHHQTDAGPLLRVLTPNSLKINTSSNRAPSGLFTIPDTPMGLMDKVEENYTLFYKVWNTDYIPLIAQSQKWHFEAENLKENDLVYFKLKESKLGSRWVLGKVEYVVTSRDNLVRKIGVSYKQTNEGGRENMNVIERPVRECIKLFNIEDTSLIDDIEAVRKASAKILDNQRVMSEPELEKITDKEEENDKPDDDLNSGEKVKKRNSQKKRKSEIEKLKIEGWKEPKTTKRTRSSKLLFNKTDVQLQPLKKPMFNLIDVGFVSKLQNSRQGDAQGLEDQAPAGPQGGYGYDLSGGFDSRPGSLFGVEVVNDLDENEPVYLL